MCWGIMAFGVVVTLAYSIAADRMETFTRSNIGVSMYLIIALLACGGCAGHLWRTRLPA